MAISLQDLKTLLKKSFPEADIQVKDLVGDSDHLSVHIIDQAFEGKSRVQCHQMVHKALGDLMKERLHALSIAASAPSKP